MSNMVRGLCTAQHANDHIIKPSEPVCGGFPHIGPIRFIDTLEWSDLWALLRAFLPPDWTVVAVEKTDPASDDPVPMLYSRRWWVYAEPGPLREPDREKRLAARVNVERGSFEEAVRALIDHFSGSHGTPT